MDLFQVFLCLVLSLLIYTICLYLALVQRSVLFPYVICFAFGGNLFVSFVASWALEVILIFLSLSLHFFVFFFSFFRDGEKRPAITLFSFSCSLLPPVLLRIYALPVLGSSFSTAFLCGGLCCIMFCYLLFLIRAYTSYPVRYIPCRRGSICLT